MRHLVTTACMCLTCLPIAQAQSPHDASLPYMPSWQARHALQLLADQAALPLPVTHWPLPAQAVRQALQTISPQGELAQAGQQVLAEIMALQTHGQVRLHLRTPCEGLPGFGDNYTPGTSGQVQSPEWQGGDATLSYAVRLGGKLEASFNSLSSAHNGVGSEQAYQLRPEGTAVVFSAMGWNLQASSQRYWRGPAWTSVGLQRASAAPSASPWLAWLGPWNFDIFLAQAQDPIVIPQQPSGFFTVACA